MTIICLILLFFAIALIVFIKKVGEKFMGLFNQMPMGFQNGELPDFSEIMKNFKN